MYFCTQNKTLFTLNCLRLFSILIYFSRSFRIHKSSLQLHSAAIQFVWFGIFILPILLLMLVVVVDIFFCRAPWLGHKFVLFVSARCFLLKYQYTHHYYCRQKTKYNESHCDCLSSLYFSQSHHTHTHIHTFFLLFYSTTEHENTQYCFLFRAAWFVLSFSVLYCHCHQCSIIAMCGFFEKPNTKRSIHIHLLGLNMLMGYWLS